MNNTCEDQKEGNEAASPALFDYLTVIEVDVLDVKTHHFWNQRKNVFEATVAFAQSIQSRESGTFLLSHRHQSYECDAQ
ncbi:hypothetical protein P3T76_015104 [Phytophthora citrophthora]|uniref:Uncharacterized protein n=1 Tax=Phytophthora citrophthora TaxID=4793 RepID=A0AAD9G0P1_9STRA|nr:hypothetical protein P3T76_015104 [Phytophthora citrophthora]